MTRYYDAFTGQPMLAAPENAWRLGDRESEAWLVGPAFFDPQVNGFGGVDFQQPGLTRDGLEHATRELQTHGCSHYLLTLITAPSEQLEAQFRRIAEWLAESALLQEAVAGFHLEGPFLSAEPGFIGAHPAEHALEPNWPLFERWQQAAGGRIRLVTVAAELPGCAEFIRRASQSGVLVSLGHTNASLEDLDHAHQAGARMITHLGNGLPANQHRHDNLIQRVLGRPGYVVSLIPDGIHVPPPALGNLTQGLGWGRLVLTTDAISAAAAPPGRYTLGTLEVEVGADGMVRLPGTQQFAGSSLTPAQGFYHVVRMGGLSADRAWRAWTWMRAWVAPDIAPPLMMLPWPVCS